MSKVYDRALKVLPALRRAYTYGTSGLCKDILSKEADIVEMALNLAVRQEQILELQNELISEYQSLVLSMQAADCGVVELAIEKVSELQNRLNKIKVIK